MIVVAVKHLNFKEEAIGEWLKYYFNWQKKKNPLSDLCTSGFVYSMLLICNLLIPPSKKNLPLLLVQY